MDPIESELLAQRCELVAEDGDVPIDVGGVIAASAADLVVDHDGSLGAQALERREVGVRRAGAAVQRDERHARKAARSENPIPRAVAPEVDVSLAHVAKPTRSVTIR